MTEQSGVPRAEKSPGKRTRWLYLILLLLAAVVSLLYYNANQFPQVSVAGGMVRGIAFPVGGATFLGIPYAAAPSGALRWQAPRPHEPWPGIRDATVPSMPCTQPALMPDTPPVVNEDCLYLNIWNSEWPPKIKKPVMVWFHGGGNMYGTGVVSALDSVGLSSYGVIVVSFNYRLGVFGFFAHPALSNEAKKMYGYHGSGNYALMDQIAALKWVKENISQFGGDPDNITAFGESAGAMDINLLLVSDSAKDLIRHAIIESSPLASKTFGTPLSLPAAEKNGKAITDLLGIGPEKDILSQLRDASASALQEASLTFNNSRKNDLAPLGWLPGSLGLNIDGKILTHDPAELMRKKKELPVDLLIGTNSVEFSHDVSEDALQTLIEQEYGPLAEKALPLYGISSSGKNGDMPPDPLYGTPAARWWTDSFFRCPSQKIADWHSEAGHKSYEYQFSLPTAPGAKYSSHFAEVSYVFGTLQYMPQMSFTEADYSISGSMQKYWTNFAKTGNPNGPDLPNWPSHTDKGGYIEFTKHGIVGHAERLREHECRLFEDNLARPAIIKH